LTVEYISGGKRSWGLSYSIQESKLNNSFVAEYQIQSIPDSTKKILEDAGILKVLDTLDIWAEKEYFFQTEYLYFNRIKYSKENYLVFRNPTTVLTCMDSTLSMKIIEGEFPDFGIYRDSVILSNHNYFQPIVNVDLMNTTPESLDILVYFKNIKSDSLDKVCGTIKLKLKNVSTDKNHIDKRPIWKRISYAL
jgi:hypothetical protein